MIIIDSKYTIERQYDGLLPSRVSEIPTDVRHILTCVTAEYVYFFLICKLKTYVRRRHSKSAVAADTRSGAGTHGLRNVLIGHLACNIHQGDFSVVIGNCSR